MRESGVLFVPENEAQSYAAVSKCKVVAVPNTIRGITPTRNWVLDHAEREGETLVVFIDDDVKDAGWLEFKEDHVKRRKLNDGELLSEFRKLFDMTEGMGYRVWGAKTENSPRSTYPFKPFLFRTYITASCMGMFSNGEKRMRFDERFTVKEDYEICLRCIKEDGGLIGARYFHWHNEHWTTEGGCKDYRTREVEMKCIGLLRKLYPGMVDHTPSPSGEYTIRLNV